MKLHAASIGLLLFTPFLLACANHDDAQTPSDMPGTEALIPDEQVDFKANGNEPGWYLNIQNGKRMEFVGDYGEVKAITPAPEPVVESRTGATIYQAMSEGHTLKVVIQQQDCNDGMSDLEYSHTVRVEYGGKTYQGCGQSTR